VTHTEGRRSAYRAVVRTQEGKRLLEGLGARGRILLKWIFKK
jgi:hypothetical protein